MLIDTHAHLDSRTLREELPAIIDRARAAGVTRIVAIGCDPDSSRECLKIAERFPEVWASVGVHPCYVTDVTVPDWLEQVRAMAGHPRCVALGEMGLDYYHLAPEGWTEPDYRARQKEFFQAQLDLAVKLKKNVIVHQRDRKGDACWRDIVGLVTPFHGKLRAVFHCWILPWADAVPMVAEGHLISFTGIATYPKAPEVLACAAEAAEGSFMLETDSPYLAPAPHRGQRNEPAYTRHTAERIATARGVSLETLAAATTRTAETFFSLPSA